MLLLQHVLVLQQETSVKSEGPQDGHARLTRRERQIMDILFERGSAPASEIHSRLADPPSYSAVRAALRVLERKGHFRHELQGLRYVWTPRLGRERARRSALRHLVRTFFEGSVEQAVAALLRENDIKLDEAGRTRLQALIERAGGAKQ
jgi:BlaI family transcriptional regulator, penicillinase repressor